MVLTEHNADGRPLKPKALPCRYCSKRFRRVEHVQRHERTHTKEKPFACTWARCGKTFGRRDLLVRHEKLVHLNDAAKDGARNRKVSSGSGYTNSSEDGADSEQMGPLPPQQRLSTVSVATGTRYPRQTSFQQQQRQQQQQQEQQPQQQMTMQGAPLLPPPPQTPSTASHSGPACNLDLLSDAATHLASAAKTGPSPPQYNDPTPPYSDRGGAGGPTREEGLLPPVAIVVGATTSSSVAAAPPPPIFDDYHLFLDDDTPAASHHHPFLTSGLEADQAFGLWGSGGASGRVSGSSGGGSSLAGLLAPPPPPLSGRMPGAPSFPSTRFSSVQPDTGGGEAGAGARGPSDAMRPAPGTAPAWRIAVADHNVIKCRLEEFSAVLPADFVCPSRHTLARFLEGYLGGFHEHLPFLHLPTMALAELAPELLLAMLAVGALYRFEAHRSNALWYAARAIALEQNRRRHSHEVHGLLPTSSAYSPHSTRPSPSTAYRHSFSAVQQDRPRTQDTHREPYSPNTPSARLETIQAMLLLFAVGLWGPKVILNETLALQSQLALLVRDEGLTAAPAAQAADWDTWVRIEGATRSKLIAYCFFNLCSIVYDTPPVVMTSEVQLALPQPARLWRAETAWQWQEARQAEELADDRDGGGGPTLPEAFAQLLLRDPQQQQQTTPSLPRVTVLGHYVLMHAFLQHIYLVKQTALPLSTRPPLSPLSPPSFFATRGQLRVEDVEDIAHGLRLWQQGFEQCGDELELPQPQQPQQQQQQQQQQQHQQPYYLSAGDGPSGAPPGGPVAFNASALLRLAYIRLHTDLLPIRRLETRDSLRIAHAFAAVPCLARSPRTTRAVVQATHALAMLVKAGVHYVARTKSLEWSMQLSLCNLECALLLSKWLVTLAALGPDDAPMSPEECTLLDNVRRLLDETEFAVPIDPSLAGPCGSGGGHGTGSSTSATTGSAVAASAASPVATTAAGDSAKLQQLAAAVIHLWAEAFKGAHIFELISVMGAGLEGYADLLEKQASERVPRARPG